MNAADKVTKLLALARDPAATSGEAATAKRLADEICCKYGVAPIRVASQGGGSTRALTGHVSPSWQPYNYEQPVNPIFRVAPEQNVSGISTMEARRMAQEILDAAHNGRCSLELGEEYLIQDAFDGLLTEFGKVLLMGLHAVVVN